MRRWQRGAPRWLARTTVAGAKRLEAFLSVRETEGGSLVPEIACGVAGIRPTTKKEKKREMGGKCRGLV